MQPTPPPFPIPDRLRESRKRVVQEARDAAQRVASSQFTATPHATVEIHAGCSDDSPIALCLIAPMRLYSRPSDRTVIGRGGSRCSAHENCSARGGGVPGIHIEIRDVAAAFSKRGSRSKWFNARHRENPEGRGRGCSASPPPPKSWTGWQLKGASPDSLILGRVPRLSNQLLLMALVPPRCRVCCFGTGSQI